MRKTISILLIISMIATLALTGCGSSKEPEGKKKTVGNIKVFVPEGWETDTAHSGQSNDGDSIFLKKDGHDTEYIWIRAVSKDAAKQAIDASAADEIDEFDTGKITWEGTENLVTAEVKGVNFLAFVYGIKFDDPAVDKILSSIKYTGEVAETSSGDDGSGDGDIEPPVDGDNTEQTNPDADTDIEPDAPAAEEVDYKAKYNGTWYGYWYFDECTGKFEKSADAYFNCYFVIDMKDDGTGTYMIYNTWDKVGSGELKIVGDQVQCTSGDAFGAPIQTDNWIFYPTTDEEKHMLVMSDTITDADGDQLDYDVYVRPWGVSWKDMEDSYVYKEMIKDVQAKMDAGEDPSVGYANDTYFK